MNGEAVRLTQVVSAPVAEVYRAFTSSTALREWLVDGAVIDARPGGRIYVWWHDGDYAAGAFTRLEPDHFVAFSWQPRGQPGPTQASVLLEARDAEVEITVEYGGFGHDDAWQEARVRSRELWSRGLENLKFVLETGQDLRYVLRPMIGVTVDEYNATIAARLGVPVREGMRIGAVGEGLGAARAGLIPNDVIVALGDTPIAGYDSFHVAMAPLHAGESVKVSYYRGSELRSALMPLSRRPIPKVPWSPEELADALRQALAPAMAEVEGCLTEVTDEQAMRRPAPGEWNVLEVLAHLIAGEREQQARIADLLCDDERWSDGSTNTETVPARIAATVAVYPRLAQMLDALRRSQEETLHIVAEIPPEFVEHRGTYWRLGRSMLENAVSPSHLEEHTAQIRAILANNN